MPRYCFHVYDSAGQHDHTPLDLPNFEAARTVARRYMSDLLKANRDEPPPRLDVCDAHGLTLISLYYSEIDAAAVSKRN